MIKAIVPAAMAVKSQPGDFVDNAVRKSAKRTSVQIADKSKIIANLVKIGKVKVIAARYDLDDGKVEYLALRSQPPERRPAPAISFWQYSAQPSLQRGDWRRHGGDILMYPFISEQPRDASCSRGQGL